MDVEVLLELAYAELALGQLAQQQQPFRIGQQLERSNGVLRCAAQPCGVDHQITGFFRHDFPFCRSLDFSISKYRIYCDRSMGR